MRYLFVLIAYLALVPFFPTLMGGLGLVVVAWWLFKVLRAIFASPPIEPGTGARIKPEGDSTQPMAPPPEEAQPDPYLHVPDQIETDEEFLVRMRAMNS